MKRIAIAALALVIAGCTSGPGHGKVVDRQYNPEWVQSGSCNTSPGTKYSPPVTTCTGPTVYPATWELRLNDGKGNEGWNEVSEHDYDKCQAQQTYPDCAGS